jgi:hypothetical protein
MGIFKDLREELCEACDLKCICDMLCVGCKKWNKF